MIKKILICFIVFFLLANCGYTQSKGAEEDEKKISQLLNSVQYSASPKTSIDICKKALEIDPNNGEAYYKLAEAYRDMANIVVKGEKKIKHYRLLSLENFSIAKELSYQNE